MPLPRPAALLALPLACLAATPATAQQQPRATAAHVFLACRYQPPTPVPSDTELKIQGFCRGMRVPLPGVEFTAHDLDWWKNDGSRIPDAGTIIRYAQLAAEQTDQAHGWLQGDPITKNQILFETGQWELTDQHRRVLQEAIQRMEQRLTDPSRGAGAEPRFRIVGYSDAIGGASEANLAVARKRAQAIQNYLVERSPQLAPYLDAVAVPRLDPAHNTESQASLSKSAAVLEAPLATGVAQDFAAAAASPPAFAGTGTSALLVGVTDVLIERANEQLQVHVMQEVTTTLCRHHETLIRQTCTLFPQGETGAYPPTVRMLRSALRDDLRTLPRSLASNAILTGIPADAAPAKRDQAVLALFLLDLIGSQQAVGDPVDALAAFPAWAQRLPVHLRVGPATPAMAHLAEFAEFVTAARAAHGQLQSYRPLILQRDSGQAIPADTVYLYALRALAVNSPETLGKVRNGLTTVERLLYARRQADTYLQSIREVRSRLREIPAGTAEQRAARVALYAELMTGVANTAMAPFQFGLEAEVRDRAAGIAIPVRNLAVGVATEDYEMALHGLVGMVNALADGRAVVERWNSCTSAARRAAARAVPGEGGEGGVACGAQPLDTRSLLDTPQLRVLSFAVDVSEAEDADAVRTSFRNFIGQGSGYRRKRAGKRENYLFANAYVGGVFGSEELSGADPGRDESYVGAYLPIGLEYGRPVGRKFSLGGFLQVLDLGSIATMRLDRDGDDELEDEAKLSKVFSPGLFAVLGIRGLPIAVGAGASYAPQARFVAGRGLDALRRSVFVAVDVPIFP